MNKKEIDRRNFLKCAATVAGSVLLGGGVPLERMASAESDFWVAGDEKKPIDPKEADARTVLKGFFERNRHRVFYSRQVEVLHEDRFFHWITNRAIRGLMEEGTIRGETRKLGDSGRINLVWHRGYRFYKRSAKRVVELVEAYADPNMTAVLGIHGEMMALAGFAGSQFIMKGRSTREFGGKVWEESEHDLDFIFERDSIAYGVEVKNTLGYMDYEEFSLKMRMCDFLGLRPVFVVRMMPRTWIRELVSRKGFAMILKYQLYPWTHRVLARRLGEELGLSVDAPRELEERTMKRFVRWHEKNVN